MTDPLAFTIDTHLHLGPGGTTRLWAATEDEALDLARTATRRLPDLDQCQVTVTATASAGTFAIRHFRADGRDSGWRAWSPDGHVGPIGTTAELRATR